MLVSISHVTRYSLAAPANYSIQCLRLTPPSFDGQQVVSWTIEMPHIENAVRFRDCFGNMAHLVAIPELHKEIAIVARGTVETEDRAGFVARPDRGRAGPRLQARDAADGALTRRSARCAAATTAEDPIERMHKLMDAVHERVQYVVGATHAHTSAAEALKDGQGVCQDHAHIFISAARVMGLPARYVNGYFLTDADEPARGAPRLGRGLDRGPGLDRFRPGQQHVPDRPLRAPRLRPRCGLGCANPRHPPGRLEEVLDVTVEVQQQSSAQQ